MSDLSLDTVLRVQRRFDVPVARVYDAWSRPEAWKHWFCVPGEGYSGRMTDFDLAVGGHYRAEMRNPNQETICQFGDFQEVRPGERLVFTHNWEQPVFGEDVDLDETLVAVDFLDGGETTTVIVTHLGFPNDAIRDEHRWGWEGILDSLAAYLRSKVAGHGRP